MYKATTFLYNRYGQVEFEIKNIKPFTFASKNTYNT